MVTRAECELAFRRAVTAVDPAQRVAAAWRHHRAAFPHRALLGVAIGKAALAMARGAGPVERGVAIMPADDAVALPPGWTRLVSAHPEPDLRSLAAADAVVDLIATATAADAVLALISGGASALVERPLPGLDLATFRAEIRAVMASGATIHELNAARIARSAIKGGRLAAGCAARICTLVVSDVVGDDPAIVGSGPTVASRPGDVTAVIAPLRSFADAFHAALQLPITVAPDPLTGEVTAIAGQLVPPTLYWGEPTIRLPPHPGAGGRAQHLALLLARRLRDTDTVAFVAGSDGTDGPPPAPAGAFVDGATWARIVAAGVDPDAALDAYDAGTALAAAGALVVTGPTGVNHADLALLV
jgi:glycerate 2-kinase